MNNVQGMCVNHPCKRFEYVAACQRGDVCPECGQLLLAPNGVDYAGETDDQKEDA